MSDFSRRSFLGFVGAAGAAFTLPALAGCGSATPSTSTTGGKVAAFPKYIPFPGPKPDLPGTADGVQGGYLSYPSSLKQSVAEKPGDGSDVNALVITYSQPPSPLEQNKLWQAVNAALGVNLKFTIVSSADYSKKMATVMAGGELPDIMFLLNNPPLPRVDQFIAATCADLTEFLSGDAVKAYPNLANLPTYVWSGAGRVNGGLWAVPIERPIFGSPMFVNRTAFGAAPTNWTSEQFREAMKGFSAGGKHWGLGSSKGAEFGLPWHIQCFGAPNTWERAADGSFTPMYDSDAFPKAFEYIRKLKTDGSFHPDMLTLSVTDMKSAFYNQTIGGMNDGLAAYQTTIGKVKKSWVPDLALPYTTGTAAGIHLSSGSVGRVVFKKATKDRIKLLLRVVDFLAAPFGSKEYELTHYGVEGTHFTRSPSGDPVFTPLRDTENPDILPVRYVMDAPTALYIPGDPDATKRLHEYEKAVIAKAKVNPAYGLSSDTQTTVIAQLNKNISDAYTAILTDRQPVSSWADVVKKWKNDGGTKIAEELAAAYKAAN
ncbi:sugar ABC transporter substrate-binding protein [Longispora fulva]|uniref:Putative aldouronate transport system substrate-binding protein n=1 Tax=Longispora fulva TaxID=619741 RepID=A0A8J7KDA5_9ACTN|nr:extracellular solute-binding protein [Longispora fulva]MBG6133845.1 putative aldouronate transport system substrate-binding protein [Longispora fulva]GIG62884.1 sugar ABC transporter substrate-binding protein [Longispora fulva]